PAPTYLQPHNLLRCKACLRAGFSLKSRLASHLGLPTMERKMLSKSSPRDQSLIANRSVPHLTQRYPKTQENQSGSSVDRSAFRLERLLIGRSDGAPPCIAGTKMHVAAQEFEVTTRKILISCSLHGILERVHFSIN